MKWYDKPYHIFVVKILHLLSFLFSKNIPLLQEKVIIVSPHPDDETFGCAGLMQRLVKLEKDVHVLILTQGEGAHNESLIKKQALIEKRKQLTLNAGQILGLSPDRYTFLDWGDGVIDNIELYEDKQKELRRIFEKLKPDLIFTPHVSEGHPDHYHSTYIVRETLKNYSSPVEHMVYCVWLLLGSYRLFFSLNWKKSYTLVMSKQEQRLKHKAMETYLEPTPFGIPYSGDIGMLPYACKWRKELYFEYNNEDRPKNP